jgi:hypothetical protein
VPRINPLTPVWYCHIDFYPGVGEVMRGPRALTIADPIPPYTPGKGGDLPVPSPFACNGEACGGPFAAPLKKLRDSLWEKYNVKPAELQPQPAPGTKPRPIYPSRPVETFTSTAGVVGTVGAAAPRAVPDWCVLWFATNQATQVRSGTTGYWIAARDDDPVARFGGVPSDYGFRAAPATWGGAMFC